jgi:hypothetical protein
MELIVAYRTGVIVGTVKFDISDAESERRDVCRCEGGEDEGERDHARGEEGGVHKFVRLVTIGEGRCRRVEGAHCTIRREVETRGKGG